MENSQSKAINVITCLKRKIPPTPTNLNLELQEQNKHMPQNSNIMAKDILKESVYISKSIQSQHTIYKFNKLKSSKIINIYQDIIIPKLINKVAIKL